MVCPLELVTGLAERGRRALGLRGRAAGRLLRSGIGVAVAYLVIQYLVAGVHIHRVPAYTASMLLGLLGAALLAGLIYRDRAFCRTLCPVGLLLGTYGRGGMLGLRPIDVGVCRACRSKDCVRAELRHRWHGRSCPSLLNPARLDTNRDCLLCTHCIEACPHRNLTLRLWRPFAAADRRERAASLPLLFFIVVVSGFVTAELCSEWPAAARAFAWPPGRIGAALGLRAHNGWLEGTWTLVVFPLSLWLVLAALSRGGNGILDRARRLALPLAVVVAGGHMAKAVAKIASWAGYLPAAVRDPAGDATAAAIAAGLAPMPGSLLAAPIVSAIAVGLVVATVVLALREARLADPKHGRTLRRRVVVVGIAFAVLAAGWSGFLTVGTEAPERRATQSQELDHGSVPP